MKKVILASVLTGLSLAATPSFAADSAVELGASASVANFYLWRGTDLGGTGGTPQVALDLNAGVGGLYGGTWVSSGDATNGTEVDVYAGYGMEMDGGLSFDLSYWSYIYPESDTGIGEVAEVAGTVGYGPVSYTAYYDVGSSTDDKDWNYMTLSASMGKFGALLGKHNDHSANGLLHADLSYSYNDNLTFTVSMPLDVESGDVTHDPMVHAALSLPLEF